MGDITYQIFLCTTYPISTFFVEHFFIFLASIGVNPYQLKSIGLLITCTLIFAIYVAAFFLVKSEWNNVRKHKRLKRLQECKNAIELETMVNDPEVAIYIIAIFMYCNIAILTFF